MTAVDTYLDLKRSSRPVLTNAEAAVRLKISPRAAGKRLRAMEDSGLIRRAKQGLWLIDPNLPPFALAPYLTAPQPAYVSMISALAFHDVTEQIPRQISVVSLDRPRTVETTMGQFKIHHIDPDLFGGFEGSPAVGYVAGVEKALFDAVYVRAAAGLTAYFPELSFPPDLDRPALDHWIGRIRSSRLRTMVERRLRSVVG